MAEEKNIKYYIVADNILPGVIKKTAEVKELLVRGEARTVNDAVEKAGISRSAANRLQNCSWPSCSHSIRSLGLKTRPRRSLRLTRRYSHSSCASIHRRLSSDRREFTTAYQRAGVFSRNPRVSSGSSWNLTHSFSIRQAARTSTGIDSPRRLSADADHSAARSIFNSTARLHDPSPPIIQIACNRSWLEYSYPSAYYHTVCPAVLAHSDHVPRGHIGCNIVDLRPVL